MFENVRGRLGWKDGVESQPWTTVKHTDR